MTINRDTFQLVIRGALKPTTLEAARAIHNSTAGHPEGVAAARALGDLSHNVFVPCDDAPGAATELLILDTWNSIEGLNKFFSDPQVQGGGDQIFKTRDPVVWQPAEIAGFMLPSPAGKGERYVGVIRAKVKSRDAARAGFDEMYRGTVNKGRMAGQVSHQVFYRLTPPGEPASLELIGIDMWSDQKGMLAFYSDLTHAAPVKDVFAGPPVTSVWKQPSGSWVEW